MKKILLAFFSILVTASFSMVTFADTLWSISDATYVSSSHGGYWDDVFNGVAFVRGTDRSLNESGRSVFFL